MLGDRVPTLEDLPRLTYARHGRRRVAARVPADLGLHPGPGRGRRDRRLLHPGRLDDLPLAVRDTSASGRLGETPRRSIPERFAPERADSHPAVRVLPVRRRLAQVHRAPTWRCCRCTSSTAMVAQRFRVHVVPGHTVDVRADGRVAAGARDPGDAAPRPERAAVADCGEDIREPAVPGSSIPRTDRSGRSRRLVWRPVPVPLLRRAPSRRAGRPACRRPRRERPRRSEPIAAALGAHGAEASPSCRRPGASDSVGRRRDRPQRRGVLGGRRARRLARADAAGPSRSSRPATRSGSRRPTAAGASTSR